MSSDDARKQPDAPFRVAGIGLHQSFRCGACDKPSSMVGRKVQRVLGLRTYVCARCAKGAA